MIQHPVNAVAYPNARILRFNMDVTRSVDDGIEYDEIDDLDDIAISRLSSLRFTDDEIFVGIT